LGYDFDLTHQKILESAKKFFMEIGFQKASIRQICGDAGVTNGAFYAHFGSKEDLFIALVEPAICGLKELYAGESNRYMELHSRADVITAMEQAFSSDTIMIHYIYEQSDAFRLILQASEGTAYADFKEQIIGEEKKITMAFLKECGPYIGNPGNISDNLIAQICSVIVSSVFDGFLSREPEERTIRETQLASEFCLAGLKQILSI
jgi:AcrR family transcriptional regulator